MRVLRPARSQRGHHLMTILRWIGAVIAVWLTVIVLLNVGVRASQVMLQGPSCASGERVNDGGWGCTLVPAGVSDGSSPRP